MKKILILMLCFLLTVFQLTACGKDTPEEPKAPPSPTDATVPRIASVRYLNLQPELEDTWEELAAAYTTEVGVPVTVITRKSDNWMHTLQELLESEDAPTLFQILRPTASDSWQPLCYDLTKTDAANQLAAADYALTEEDSLLALPCGVAASGIWVNRTLLAQVGYTPEDITSRESLKTIAEAVTADSENLNFSAFTLPGFPEDALKNLHMELACTAIAWEFQENALSEAEDFTGTALDSLRELLDIMLENGTKLPEALAETSREASLAEFMDGKALFCVGSSADWDALSAVFSQDELALLPAFLNEEEETEETEETQETTAGETTATEETEASQEDTLQGLRIGAEYFWCVNPDSHPQDLAVTLDFLNWCLGTEEGAAALAAMGYELPYLTAPEQENPFLPPADDEDLLFCRHWAMPSGQWQTALHNALADYTADPTDSNWDTVCEVFADYWAAEYALNLSAEASGEG